MQQMGCEYSDQVSQPWEGQSIFSLADGSGPVSAQTSIPFLEETT